MLIKLCVISHIQISEFILETYAYEESPIVVIIKFCQNDMAIFTYSTVHPPPKAIHLAYSVSEYIVCSLRHKGTKILEPYLRGNVSMPRINSLVGSMIASSVKFIE